MATRQSITEKVTHISAGETRHLKEKHKYVLIVLLLILHEIQKSIEFLRFLFEYNCLVTYYVIPNFKI